MSESLYLHLSSQRANGGSFQYDLNALDAALCLASQGVPLFVGYEHPEWKSFIPENVNSIWIPRRGWVNALFKGLATMGAPLGLMRLLFRLVHPASGYINPSPSVGKFFTSQESQLAYLAPGPSVGVVHDLMHRYETSFPEAASAIRRWYRDRHFKLLAMTADGVCVDSELGRRQLAESYGIPAEKMDVLTFAVPPYALENPSDDFEARYSLPPKFLFYPATLWQHKNHACILRAMARLLPEIQDLHLVLAGGSGNAEADVNLLVSDLGLTDHVHRMGYVADRDMSGFYLRARALVMASFFGPTNIPPVEAMHHGCPVLVADNYGMPEQCGDACIPFDPRNPEQLAQAIARIWTDDELAKSLAEKGRRRSEYFSKLRFLATCTGILRRRLDLDQVSRC
jgi:glycosyltransferase involved in cell wall biosynthesis